MNVNYLGDNDQKSLLNNLLLLYNLNALVDFPTRISQSTASAIDNIIIDISQFDDYSVYPLANDLSDHDAQTLTLKIPTKKQRELIKLVRKMDESAINDFTYQLSYESWEIFLF